MPSARWQLVYADGSLKRINRRERDQLLAAKEIRQIGPKKYKSIAWAPKIQRSQDAFVNCTVSTYDPRGKVHAWVNSHIRRSRNDNAPGVHTESQWLERIRYFGWHCRYCNVKLTPETVTKDHQIPLARKGSNWAANLVPACAWCNGSKHDRKPSEWRVENT